MGSNGFAIIFVERAKVKYAFLRSLPEAIQGGHFMTSHSDRDADELMLESLFPSGEDGGLAGEVNRDEFAGHVRGGAEIVEFGISSGIHR